MRRRLHFVRLLPLLALMILLAAALPVRADTGPKPSVTITLKNLPAGEVYATLLSAVASTGPYSSVGKKDLGPNALNEEKAWNAFCDYAENDAYYFLGYIQNVTRGQTFRWGYYPPQNFKLLIYVVQEDRCLCSEEARRYAFDSLFTADCAAQPILPERIVLSDIRLVPFLMRIVLTLVIELAVAFFFRLRSRKQILVILAANLATQFLLNLFLMNGPSLSRLPLLSSWGLLFIVCEAGVFVAEAIVYTRTLASTDHSSKELRLYAFCANLASLVLGWIASVLFPSLL